MRIPDGWKVLLSDAQGSMRGSVDIGGNDPSKAIAHAEIQREIMEMIRIALIDLESLTPATPPAPIQAPASARPFRSGDRVRERQAPTGSPEGLVVEVMGQGRATVARVKFPEIETAIAFEPSELELVQPAALKVGDKVRTIPGPNRGEGEGEIVEIIDRPGALPYRVRFPRTAAQSHWSYPYDTWFAESDLVYAGPADPKGGK